MNAREFERIELAPGKTTHQFGYTSRPRSGIRMRSYSIEVQPDSLEYWFACVVSRVDMETITEQQFKTLCDDTYFERREIYPLNPNVSHREALLWMLLGKLVSLLSVPIVEQPSVYGEANSDPFGIAVIELVKQRASPFFDPSIHINALSEKLETEL